VLSKTIGLKKKKKKVMGGWRNLHTQNLRNFYSLPNIITEIKSRRLRRATYVDNMKI
jgi:hypothetical protein